MPLRENQVYQIGLITAVMLMVVAGGLGFYGLSSSNQQTEINARLTADKQKVEAELRSMRNAFEACMMMIGYKDTSNLGNALSQVTDPENKKDMDGVKELYDRLVKSYGIKDPNDEQKTLSSLISNLINSIAQKGKLARRSESQSAQHKTDLEVAEARHVATVADLNKAKDELKKSNDSLRQALKTAETNFLARRKEAEQKHQEAVLVLEKDVLEERKAKKVIYDDLKEQISLADALESKLRKFERKTFLLPDGYIVDVVPATGNAYVNLGRADGLYNRISFSVFGEDVPLEAGKEKGTIEIIRIDGDHRATARIVNFDPKNPIIRKDRIVTATWDPGQKVRVAIAGIVDFDEDGVSDLDQLKGLIRKNKGVLVAESSETGKVLGAVDVKTQFLIEGDVPGGKQHFSSFTKMIDAADKFRTRRISVRDFLHLNGYHPEPSIQSLLKDSSSTSGFKARKPPEGSSAFDQ